MRGLEWFSGIGGWHWAIETSSQNKLVSIAMAFDISQNANSVYSFNFPEVAVNAVRFSHLLH